MRYIFLRYPEGREKAITLSYDDGCTGDRRLIETANRYGLKLTLNLDLLEKGFANRMPRAKLAALLAGTDHEVAVHGANHIASGTASVTRGIADVYECRKALEAQFGRIIRGMAYPDSGIRQLVAGVSRDEIAAYLHSLGIVYARTLAGDNDGFMLPENFYAWMPTAHHNNPHLFEWLDKFLTTPLHEYGASRYPLLFYLWGHSYEFDNDGNWARFEEFCEQAGGHDEIWYATNIEIYDYVTAYRSLIFSLDASRVYNPTCRTIWFEADRRVYAISPNETLTL